MAPNNNDRRKTNSALPKYWRKRKNTFYLRVPPHMRDKLGGKAEISLGQSIAAAHAKAAELYETEECISLVRELLDRYTFEVIPTYESRNTREQKERAIARLRPSLGSNLLTTIDSQVCNKYMDKVAKKVGETSANRDYETLSHAFSMAVRWGVIKDHPFKGQVEKYAGGGEGRYVEDWELDEWAKVANPFLVAYVKLKGATALRQQDLLMLEKKQITDTHLVVTPIKTRRKTKKPAKVIRLPLYNEDGSPSSVRLALDAVDQYYREKAQAKIRNRTPGRLPPVINTRWVFTTRTGGCYYDFENRRAPGFKNIWGRSMKKALAMTKLEEKFTEHDLRGKVGSDFDTDEEARATLGHADAATTRKHYRRKGSVVQPGKGFFTDVDSAD